MIHRGNGAPTVNTPGFIGDTYINEDTGEKYKCTFAYKCIFNDPEYTWKKTDEPAKVKVEEKPKKDIPVEKPIETKVETPEVVEEKPEETVPYKEKQKFNYNKQYRK